MVHLALAILNLTVTPYLILEMFVNAFRVYVFRLNWWRLETNVQNGAKNATSFRRYLRAFSFILPTYYLF